MTSNEKNHRKISPSICDVLDSPEVIYVFLLFLLFCVHTLSAKLPVETPQRSESVLYMDCKYKEPEHSGAGE